LQLEGIFFRQLPAHRPCALAKKNKKAYRKKTWQVLKKLIQTAWKYEIC